jgi:hypothetical protein
MGRPQSLMFDMNAPCQGEGTALDYEERAADVVAPVVELATNPAWIKTRQRRVQTSTRRSGSLERCWAALPMVPVGARSAKPSGALLPAANLIRSRFEGPVRFG